MSQTVVEHVAELVEQRDDFIVPQQGGGFPCGLGEVGDDRRHRKHIAGVLLMAGHQVERGRVPEFPFSGKEIHIERGELGIGIGVMDVVCEHVGMPSLGVVYPTVFETEHILGDLEHPVENLLQREVGRHF